MNDLSPAAAVPRAPGQAAPARIVLVTGAGRRVGAQIACSLHAAGCTIAIHYRHSGAEAQALAARLCAQRPDSAACFAADLLDGEQRGALMAAVLARFGRLDALINNASLFYRRALAATDEASWDELVGSNFKAPLFLAQAAAAHLTASQGCIVNISDIHAQRPLAGFALYSAAKGALDTLTRALAIELAPAVRVNAVAPGAIAWPDDEAGLQAFPEAERRAIIAHTLLGRMGSPLDIARTVKFLVLDAPYITGQVICVDGGRTAHL